MPHRIPFDPKRPLVAARAFRFAGVEYGPGDPFAPEGADQRLLRRQYEARAVNHGEATAAADEPPAEAVTMEGPKGGRYTISAPWLDEPEVVRGKANAEARLAELREAGEPDSYKGYTVTAKGGGWYGITKDGVEGTDGAEAPVLNVQGEDEARKVVAQLRAGEEPADTALPAEWTPQPPEGGEGGNENGSDDSGADTGEQGGESAAGADPADGPGGDQPAQETSMPKEGEPNEEGNAPNEPGTNQPNGAEVINDKVAAEPGNARSDTAGEDGESDDDGTDGGDGTTGTVGP